MSKSKDADYLISDLFSAHQKTYHMIPQHSTTRLVFFCSNSILNETLTLLFGICKFLSHFDLHLKNVNFNKSSGVYRYKYHGCFFFNPNIQSFWIVRDKFVCRWTLFFCWRKQRYIELIFIILYINWLFWFEFMIDSYQKLSYKKI